MNFEEAGEVGALLQRIRKKQMTDEDKAALQRQLQERVCRKELTGTQANLIWERILKGVV